MIGTAHYLVLSAILFAVGLYGVIARRNILLVLLAVELMLNAANLSFVAFAGQNSNLSGQVVVFFTMIVAAVEVTVGLALVILLYRKCRSTRVDRLGTLKW